MLSSVFTSVVPPSQTERDTIEVIAYLKHEDTEKDQELDHLKQQLKDFKVESRNEREALDDEHSQQISKLESVLAEKNEEVLLYTYNVHVLACTLYKILHVTRC